MNAFELGERNSIVRDQNLFRSKDWSREFNCLPELDSSCRLNLRVLYQIVNQQIINFVISHLSEQTLHFKGDELNRIRRAARKNLVGSLRYTSRNAS
jgi:hypothetical protein